MRSEGNNVNRSIIVIQDKITPFAKQSLSEMQPKIMIEVFREAELLVNITKHVLVPEHRVLSTEEKLTLLKTVQGEGDATAQNPVQRSDRPLLRDVERTSGAHRETLRNGWAVRHVQVLCVVIHSNTYDHLTCPIPDPRVPCARRRIHGRDI